MFAGEVNGKMIHLPGVGTIFHEIIPHGRESLLCLHQKFIDTPDFSLSALIKIRDNGFLYIPGACTFLSHRYGKRGQFIDTMPAPTALLRRPEEMATTEAATAAPPAVGSSRLNASCLQDW